MLISVEQSATGVIVRLKILDKSKTDGSGLTGLLYTSTGLQIATIADNESATTVYTVAASNVETITTLGTYAAPTASKCRFKEVDATNHPGVYELQFANARFSVSGARSLLISIKGATNCAETDALIDLEDLNKKADALLKRDWTAVTGEAARSILNALRFLRNKWSISGGTLTVTKEDDTTSAWTAALTTNASADPVVSSDPS
jgi:hypothetical protein